MQRCIVSCRGCRKAAEQRRQERRQEGAQEVPAHYITSHPTVHGVNEKEKQGDEEHLPFPLPFSSSCKEQKQTELVLENNQYTSVKEKIK